MMKRMSGGGAGGAGWYFQCRKIKGQIFDKDTNVKLNFNDVAGLEEAKDRKLWKSLIFLKIQEIYKSRRQDSKKGALLIGPPGNRKNNAC